MPDREKVINAIDICLGHGKCDDCGYRIKGSYSTMDCRKPMMRDALDLLKEDCHNCKLECLLQKYDELKEKYDALLKEQETKKVLQIRKLANRTIGYCPSCGRVLDNYEDGNSRDHITNYCYNCGQAVKWE